MKNNSNGDVEIALNNNFKVIRNQANGTIELLKGKKLIDKRLGIQNIMDMGEILHIWKTKINNNE
jgi:hypothetical protein